MGLIVCASLRHVDIAILLLLILLLLPLLSLIAGVDDFGRVLAAIGFSPSHSHGASPPSLTTTGTRMLVSVKSATAATVLTSSASTAASSSCASSRNVANWAKSSLGYHALTNSRARRAPARAAEPFQASRRPAATSSQSAVWLGVRRAGKPG